MKKIFWLTICLILGVLALSFTIWNEQRGPKQETPQAQQTDFSAVDSRGKEIILEGKPQRIISLAPANTEILFALGLDEEIVGITDYCNYPPEKVVKIEKIGGFSTPNIEKIVSLNPDIVFGTSGVQKQAVQRLEELGIKVYVLEAETMENLLAEIEKVGKVTGKSQEAKNLTESLKKRIELIKTKVANLSDEQKPKVFLEIWYDPIWIAPDRTLIYQVIELVGGRHAITIKGDWNQVTTIDPESVINANPDVIFLAFEGSPELIYKLPGWSNVSAVKNKQVFQINGDIISRTGPRIVDALEQIAKILHPGLF